MQSVTVLDRAIGIDCLDGVAEALLASKFGETQGSARAFDLTYRVGRQSRNGAFFIERGGQPRLLAADTGELMFLFDQDVTVQLQKLRPDLYFIHSAALEHEGRSFLLVAPSGCGKSTTAWGLSHHGFRYLSDELAPIDVNRREVHPYPRALCLKDDPPEPYTLPPETLETSISAHVAVSSLPGGYAASALALASIFFIRYDPELTGASVDRISGAEGATRLFANALNPLAHPGDGLPAAIEIARGSACFKLSFSDLPRACALIEKTLEAEA